MKFIIPICITLFLFSCNASTSSHVDEEEDVSFTNSEIDAENEAAVDTLKTKVQEAKEEK